MARRKVSALLVTGILLVTALAGAQTEAEIELAIQGFNRAKSLHQERRYEDAVEWARKALRLPNFQWSRYMILASALGHLGRTEEARALIDALLERIPNFSASYMLDFSPMIENADFRHMVDGLHKAGLPE